MLKKSITANSNGVMTQSHVIKWSTVASTPSCLQQNWTTPNRTCIICNSTQNKKQTPVNNLYKLKPDQCGISGTDADIGVQISISNILGEIICSTYISRMWLSNMCGKNIYWEQDISHLTNFFQTSVLWTVNTYCT